MTKALLIAAGMTISLTAFAGKGEREVMKNYVVPAIQKAEAAYKTSCGCALTITVNPAIQSKSDLHEAAHMARTVADNAPKHCTDQESRKAMCRMKRLDLTRGDKAGFTFSGGLGVSMTDGAVIPTWDMIAREVDK